MCPSRSTARVLRGRFRVSPEVAPVVAIDTNGFVFGDEAEGRFDCLVFEDTEVEDEDSI